MDLIAIQTFLSKQWTNVSNTRVGKRNRGLLTILLILCGDIEFIPGPANVSFLSEFCGECGLKIVDQNICGLPDKFNLLEALWINITVKLTLYLYLRQILWTVIKMMTTNFMNYPATGLRKEINKMLMEVVLLFMWKTVLHLSDG